MKKIALLLVGLGVMDAFAQTSPVDCYETSGNYPLSVKQRVALCTAALSEATTRCFEFCSIIGSATPEQCANLCQAAPSDAPARCFADSLELNLSVDQKVKLCTYSLTTAPVQCYAVALDFPLAPDDRLTLCRFAHSDDPIHCVFSTGMEPLTMDQRVKLCAELPAIYGTP